MLNPGLDHLMQICFTHHRGFHLSLDIMRECHCQPCKRGGYFGIAIEGMEPQSTKHQFSQILDVVCEVRSLVQNYEEDERVQGVEASSKI